MSKTHSSLIASELSIAIKQVENTIALLKEGATVPFIARYRKEMTGSLDEVAIADIKNSLHKFEELAKRKATILSTIEEQGKLSPELQKRIEDCFDVTELEDIYLPYKPKRKTRASVAKENGLEPLAQLLFSQQQQAATKWSLAQYYNEKILNDDDALQGARDIIAEWVNEDEAARQRIRNRFKKEAVLKSKVARGKEDVGIKYKDYFAFEEPLSKSPSHRLLAMLRGEEEGFLRITIEPEEATAIDTLERQFLKGNGDASQQVKQAISDSYQRLLMPSIETEFRNIAKEKADAEAIKVFADNLRQLLLLAPLGQKRVLALDSGFRTGCKLVCLASNGDLLYNTTIYPHPPQSEVEQSRKQLQYLVKQYDIEAIAVGNGTAGRETVDFCRKIDFDKKVEVFSVNESGASIYSASEVAREEFPDYDITVRGAVSIGRRLMDPLAELVKIDPKSIGVGQYQHDVNQTKLRSSLDGIVESCVNNVGINLNTASKHLLTYVSGLGPTLAQNIVTYRTENGKFTVREQLKKVPRLGDKAFEQCAGFLRIRHAKHPLDATAVHPESYPVVEQMAADLQCNVQDLIAQPDLRKQIDIQRYVTPTVGLPTLRDILRELEKPGLDPRGEATSFSFGNVYSIEALREGMLLPGIVTNVTNFGAFVDIGVKQDGLVHISEIANRFIKHPSEVVQLQQEVEVRVVAVDIPRKRINLSMRLQ
ncbi:MAG: RNA-binding transcriptional accessory protein [Saprospiraceae bacterium]|nr:RNA-binding transcriptional accessory protein [Saprospiraceae bacterium]MBP7679776.1 RNA-binding transcriptional accessory protein [Saprospiraceae bacterium]